MAHADAVYYVSIYRAAFVSTAPVNQMPSLLIWLPIFVLSCRRYGVFCWKCEDLSLHM